MAHDALGAHARDEIGISKVFFAPQLLQAAFSSAGTFTVGAALPWPGSVVCTGSQLISVVAVSFIGFSRSSSGLLARGRRGPDSVWASE